MGGRRLLLLIIEHTMAIALKIRIGDLALEFLAHTFIFFRPGEPARAIAARALQPLADLRDDFLVLVQAYFHSAASMRARMLALSA